MRISTLFTLMDLCQATQSYKGLPSDLAGEAAVMDMLAVRATGIAGQPCVSDTTQQVEETYKVGLEDI